MEAPVHYGETTCQGQSAKGAACRNKAYWKAGGRVLCGTHSRGRTRTELPKLSKAAKARAAQKKREKESEDIASAARKNRDNGLKGDVVLERMLMLRAPRDLPGYLKVFPNFRHQHRKDGLGCSSLSPMSLGPVRHGQPGLPDSLSIENFFQASKCFREEADEAGNPARLFYKNRKRFYLDPSPTATSSKETGRTRTFRCTLSGKTPTGSTG